MKLLLLLLFTCSIHAESLCDILDTTVGVKLYSCYPKEYEFTRVEKNLQQQYHLGGYEELLNRLGQFEEDSTALVNDSLFRSQLITFRFEGKWGKARYCDGNGDHLLNKRGRAINNYSLLVYEGKVDVPEPAMEQFRKDQIQKSFAGSGMVLGSISAGVCGGFLLGALLSAIIPPSLEEPHPVPIDEENGEYEQQEMKQSGSSRTLTQSMLIGAAISGGASVGLLSFSIPLYSKAADRQMSLIFDHNKRSLAERFNRRCISQ